MKKLILVLAILLAVPAFAALDVNLVKVGDDVQIVYTGADPCNLPRAFALDVNVSGGAVIDGISGYKVGEGNESSKGFGIYPASIVIEANGNVTSWGTPLADSGDPLSGSGLHTGHIVLEFGSLYVDEANAPPTSGTLCVLDVNCKTATGDVNIVLTDEAIARGGVVLEEGNTVDVSKLLKYPCTTDCLWVGKVFAYDCCQPPVTLTVSSAMVTMWNYLGKPNCWCCNAQKCGNGVYTGSSAGRVDGSDLSALQVAYNKRHTQPGYNPCLDFNLSGRIDGSDLSVLQLHYNKRPGSSACL